MPRRLEGQVVAGETGGWSAHKALWRYREVVMNRRLNEKFRRLFGVRLHQFMSPLTGFDLLKFDDVVVRSMDLDGVSMADVLRKKYGEEAVALIRGLIGNAEEDKTTG